MPMPRSEGAPVMTAVRCVAPIGVLPWLDEVGNVLGCLGSGRSPLIVGDVACLEFQREVARVAGVGEGLEAACEVDAPTADAEVDVPGHRVANVYMRDPISEP